MKDNFTNPQYHKYLKNNQSGSQSGYVNDYVNLVNQPSAFDDVGDAFTKAGSGSANGPQGHEANALLLGMGAGVKGIMNAKRQTQLEPYLKMTGQLAAQEQALAAQRQKVQAERETISQFYRQSAPMIFERSKASLASDTGAVAKLDQGILTMYKQITQDPSIGEYSHSNDGSIYFMNNETGVIEGRNPVHLMYQMGINPAEIFGQDAPLVEAAYSPGAKQNYENTQKTQQLDIQKKQADIGNSWASSNLHNAQAKAALNKKEDPKILEKEQHRKELVHTLDEAEKQINMLGKKAYRGGAERYLAENTPGGYNMSLEEAKIDTLGKVLKGKLFNTWGYSNQAEFHEVPSISFENTPEVNLAIIRQMKNLINNSNPNGVLDNSPSSAEENTMVQVLSPSGKVGMIPRDSLQAAEKKGYKVAQ